MNCVLLFTPPVVGSLAPGRFADIIAVEGDALADLRSFEKIGFVMKGGFVYKQP